MDDTTLNPEPSLATATDWSLPQTARAERVDDTSLQAEHDTVRRQFRRLLIALTLLIGIATLIDVILFASSGSPDLYPHLILDTFFLSVISATWWFYRRGRVGIASLCLSATTIALSLFFLTQFISTSFIFDGAFVVIGLALAPAMALSYVDTRTFQMLSILVGAIGWVTMTYLAYVSNGEGVLTDVAIGSMVGSSVGITVLLFLLWQFSHQQRNLVDNLRQRTSELEHLQGELEQQVINRTTMLLNLQTQNEVQERLLREIRAQQSLIHDLSVPILPITPTVLVLPLIGTLDHHRLELIRQRALEAVEQAHARTLILDVTGVPELDQHGAQGLLLVAQATRMMGSQCVLAGLRPRLAQALVQLGVELRSLRTYATLQRALEAVGGPCSTRRAVGG